MTAPTLGPVTRDVRRGVFSGVHVESAWGSLNVAATEDDLADLGVGLDSYGEPVGSLRIAAAGR